MVGFLLLLLGIVALFPVLNTSQYACQVGQVLYPHDRIFTEEEGDHCIIQRCSYGQVQYISEGCLNGDDCFPLGTGFENEICVTQNCTKNNLNELTWDPISRRCHNEGRCYSLGETVENDECVTHNCTKDVRGRIRWDDISRRCLKSGLCYSLGTFVRDADCSTLNCTKNNDDEFRWDPIIRRCLFGYECYPLGYLLQNIGCSRFRCNITAQNETVWDHVNRTPGCSYDRFCYPEGQILQYNNCTRLNCTKDENDVLNMVTLNKGCNLGSNCYDVGDQAIFSCKLHECVDSLESGASWDVLEPYCLFQGQCVLRDVPREFIYQGTVYQNCTCYFANIYGLGINCTGQLLGVAPDQ